MSKKQIPDGGGKDFWEDIWQEIPAGGYRGVERYLAINRRLNRLLRRFIPRGKGRVLELGCARGKFLANFAREFGYEAWGIDYSERGAAMARENLRRAGVAGKVICQDIFQSDLPEASFDVVYSMGLIEHFEDPAAIIEAHVRLLKNGGTLFITVPNLRRSLAAALNSLTGRGRALLARHNTAVMEKETLRRLVADRDIRVLALDYFGPLDLSGTFSNIRWTPLLYPAHFLNQILGYATFYLPASAYLSPYLVLVGRKEAA